MNAERRKAIEAIKARADDLRQQAGELMADIEDIKEEEADYYDNMPESLQNGEKGEKAQAAIDALESAHSAIEDLDSGLDDMQAYLDTASE